MEQKRLGTAALDKYFHVQKKKKKSSISKHSVSKEHNTDIKKQNFCQQNPKICIAVF